ncbi:MAG: helix-turn-helix domain-containing protein [Actinobacteria bacterium]|nr:helix-turn-helix domain-containing protein [Actinomycetota bacterium]
MDIDDLAANLGVTERFVRRLVEENRIDYHKVGKFIRFHPNDVDGWIADTRVNKRNDNWPTRSCHSRKPNSMLLRIAEENPWPVSTHERHLRDNSAGMSCTASRTIGNR